VLRLDWCSEETLLRVGLMLMSGVYVLQYLPCWYMMCSLVWKHTRYYSRTSRTVFCSEDFVAYIVDWCVEWMSCNIWFWCNMIWYMILMCSAVFGNTPDTTQEQVGQWFVQRTLLHWINVWNVCLAILFGATWYIMCSPAVWKYTKISITQDDNSWTVIFQFF